MQIAFEGAYPGIVRVSTMLIYYLQMIESDEDGTKFELLYETYKPLMMYIARKILMNDDDACDAVHDAFLAIARNIKKIRMAESNETKALVAMITERKAIDIYRKRQKKQENETSDECLSFVHSTTDTYNEGSVLDKLPIHYREVLILKYKYGYSNSEVAEILDSTTEAVHKMSYRAKKQLQEILEGEGVLK